MPETASPDNDVSIADPQAHETGADANNLHEGDVITAGLKAKDVSHEAGTNVLANTDAPAYTNGHPPRHVNGNGGHDEEDSRPAKRRRTHNSTPPPTPSSAKKLKPISPPWKRISAEGPTSFTENGRRKSGRINTLPLELQPQGKKRLTRQSLGSKGTAKPAKKADATSNRPPNNKVGSQKKLLGMPKSTSRKPEAPPSRISSRSLRRRSPSPPAHPTRQSTRTRRAFHAANASDAQDELSTPTHDPTYQFHDGDGRSPRIKLRVGRSGFIPLVHADQVRKRPKVGTSFEDFWARAGTIPVEDGGLFASEDGPIYTDEAAMKDAFSMARIEQEVQPGGILSLGRCSAFIPEEEEEPSRQYARQDHLIKAMANFRKLLLLEQQRHRAIAKKLAEACRDAWVDRQPKSAEQLEAEARQKWIGHYRYVIRAMLGTWENVRAQVNRRRLEQWEAEEQKRVKAALNEALGRDATEGDDPTLKQQVDEIASLVSLPSADYQPFTSAHDHPVVSLVEDSANAENSKAASQDQEGSKIEPSDRNTTEMVPPLQEMQAGSPNEDVTMADAHDEDAVQPQVSTQAADLGKPSSPETEPVTNPTSPRRSQSPPTSDTKPSEVEASSAELAVAKPSGSRSVTPHTPSTHKSDIPFLLRGTLREYQHDGLDWLAGLYANNTNGILADEMGLGKTIQTIALLAHLACYHEVWGPHLVIVPTSVMLNWEMEFKKWCPGFKILAYYGSQDERKRKRQGWNNDDVWNVCITSYQLVLQDQQVFKRRRWHYLVLDEAHNIKNFKSQRWQTLLGFNTQARLLLTGTPLQNNLTELWSLLFFLMPAENGVGGFADLQEFQDWFHKPESQILESGRDQMDEEARAIISKLHKVLRPYLLRRLKADVEKQMPAKYEHVEFCRLSKRQRELYDGFLSRSDTKETLSSGNYLSIINCLMQLRKVCNHPDLFIDRPIMTSFRMSKSVPAEYTFTERKVRSLLADAPMNTVNLGFLNLVPTQHEKLSSVNADRIAQLSSHRALMDLREAQKVRAQAAHTIIDPSTVGSSISYLESGARWGRFEELQHCVYLNALRRQQRPVYGKNVVDLVSINAYKRPCRPKPKIPQKIMSWFEGDLAFVRALTPTLDQRAETLKSTISKFSCVTPPVVTRDLEQVLLGPKAVQAFTDEDLRLSAPVRWAPFLPKQAPRDPWHESRMRHSIQFPDKRLLQYDCGKLQVLDKLLRKLQAGGHRALIFTQMTKVLDILEQFLNIHGHKYLRLDGATKVEQRQILTDRFNNDPRILCFILSTRSGGLGINLTGADTVIFYDQDWNPAMDKQCQDRCHRIGQTRDVHIYRLVSEHTIEANILRKASQKQMLDDVVIQEGEFTTDYFNKISVREVLEDKVDFTSEGVAAADAALERVLGGPDTSRDQRTVGRALEQAEDREDVAAARVAEREIQADDADFTEKTNGTASGTSTTRQGTPAGKSVMDSGLDLEEMTPIGEGEIEYNAYGESMGNIDQYMLKVMTEELKHTKLELPKGMKKNKKKGRDTRKR
ncbi:Helicase SWR1 [Metarhizium anisopliae]|nr:Helicase SWR1 [Metarhizium anisopliae]